MADADETETLAPKAVVDEPETESSTKYEFDDLLKLVGGFGRYNVLLYVFMCLLSIPIGFQQLIQVFYGASPAFNCVRPSEIAILNQTCGVSKCCVNCTSYTYGTQFTSAVSEWNLICNRAHLKAMTQAIYMAGLLVGSYVFSSISDAFGRRVGAFLSILFMAGFGSASAVADCLSMFAMFRFLAGAGTAGCLLVRFVYCMEMTVTKHRTAAGMVTNIVVAVGFILLAPIAYLIRDWRHLMLAVSTPGLPLLLFWWWIPESPRWLMAENRIDEAHALLLKYARINRAEVDSEGLRKTLEHVRKADLIKTVKDDKKKAGIYRVLHLIKTKKLRKRTLICSFNWFVNALVFYGISLSAKNLGGNMYLNYFLLVIPDVVGGFLSWFLLQRFGRRFSYCGLMVTGGIAGLMVLAVPTSQEYQPAVLSLAILGKLCITATFMSIYVFTAELYPTVIRNTGVGFSSMMARVGGAIAPYIVLLADLPGVGKSIPLVIFGIMGLTAGVLSLWLPETLYYPIPQTVEQVEAWKEDYRMPWRLRRRKRNDDVEGESMKMMKDHNP